MVQAKIILAESDTFIHLRNGFIRSQNDTGNRQHRFGWLASLI